MSSEIRETIEGIYQRLDPAIYRVPDTNDRIDIRDRLTGADYISLGALLFGWASALLLVRGEPNWGVIVMFAAFGFDVIIAICPLMISNYKAKKTTAGHVFIGILITIVTLLALAIETGYL